MRSVSEQDRLVQLRRLLVERLGESELDTLCFDLGIDHELLPGTDKLTKVRELLVYLERRTRIPDLIAIGAQLRPDLAWFDGPTPWSSEAGAPQARTQGQAGDQGGGGVHIGDVGGSIQGNVIVGRDARDVRLSWGSTPPGLAEDMPSVDRTPTVHILLELLSHIEGDLGQVIAQRETLEALSAAAPYMTIGAQESIRAASAQMQEAPNMAPERATSVRKSLVEAAELVKGLQGAVPGAGPTEAIARALGAALPKIDLAARWVARLWALEEER